MAKFTIADSHFSDTECNSDESQYSYEEDEEEAWYTDEEESEDEGMHGDRGHATQDDREILPIPDHLIPPTEVQLLILREVTPIFTQWELRQVCRAWNDYMERLARDVWPKTSDPCLHFIHDPDLWFQLKGIEDGEATFTLNPDIDLDKKSKQELVRHFTSNYSKPVACELDAYVHDAEIPSMIYHADTLLITVPWRDFIVSVLGQEIFYDHVHGEEMDPLFAFAHDARAKIAKGELDFLQVLPDIMRMYGKQAMDDYSVARAKRVGWKDPDRDKWLRELRVAAGWKD